MPTHTLSNHESFPYDDIPPGDEGVTFAFFNALSGDRGMWLQSVGDRLQAAGHGLLAWNFRGQPETSFTITQTDEETIVSDSLSLIGELQPKRLVYVGLSIGGLYAIRAHLKGGVGAAVGLVLINTLRKSGPRLDWVNHAVVRMAETGGLAMMRDFYAPLLMNQAWQAENRDAFFSTDYAPLPEGDGTLMLLRSGISADWDIPYETISIPTLSITGLQDRVFRDPADVDELSRRIPNLTRVDLPDAGHMVPVEQPAALADALVDFAAGLSKS